MSSWLLRLTSRRCSARHERQVRSGLSEQCALVEHPLHRATRQADERARCDDAIEPQIDRHDGRGRRLRSAASMTWSSAAGRLSNNADNAVPGNRADHGAGTKDLFLHSNRRPMHRRPARAPAWVRTSPPRRWMNACGNRVDLVERAQHQTRARSPFGRGQTFCAAPHRTSHRGVVDRLIQRGDGKRFPQQLDQARRLPVRLEPLANRCVWIDVAAAAVPQPCKRKPVAPVDAHSIASPPRADAAAPESPGTPVSTRARPCR